MFLRRIRLGAVMLQLTLVLGGCATFLNDDHQMVAFYSDPEGAMVSINDAKVGLTPGVFPVARKDFDKKITFELDGYKTLIMTLKNKIAPAAFGNILIGGFIGAGVDAISGRAGSYEESVKVELEPGTGIVDKTDEKKQKTTAAEAQDDTTANP